MVSAMNAKTLRTQTITRVAVVFGILVLLNFVSVRLFGRFDLTRNDLFSLSDASKQLVRSLDDRLTVKAYFTEGLPAPHNNTRRVVLDELNEFKAYSRGNLQFEFISPEGEKGEQEAQQQGIAPVQAQVIKNDKLEVMRGYMGLVFLYEDKKEVIPVVQNTGTLEYDIASTIKRLTTKTRKKVAFLTGHGEPGLNELSKVQQVIGKQYTVTTVDVSKGKPVPTDISALIVMAPTSRLPETDKFQIDQYIMGGGKVAFLLNRIEANLQQQFGRPMEIGLDDMLATYGLKVNEDLVRDEQCANISIQQQQFGFNMVSQVPFPFIPLASDFSKSNIMVKDLQGVMLFFVSSIDTAGAAAKNLRADILMASSEQSGRQTGFFMFDPTHRYTREEFTKEFGESHIPLAAVVEGQFKSAFAGKPVPVDTAAGAIPPSGSPLEQSPETRVVLVGDGDFARDQYLGNRDNISFFANMVDYLVDDAGLITIRAKDVSLPPLEQVEDGTKKMIKYGDLILPPAIIAGYGLFRWRVRKLRRKAMESQ